MGAKSAEREVHGCTESLVHEKAVIETGHGVRIDEAATVT